MSVSNTDKIVVVGLGYVGLPLAVALAKTFDVTGLDIDRRRIEELGDGHDRTNEIERETLAASQLKLSSDPAECAGRDVYIVTVPTPVDEANQPDLRPVLGATRTLAKLLDPARKAIVVYESTVYPGVTDEICGPLIEEVSGLVRGRDFFLGYSPERINPGDREHTVDRIVKVIAGENEAVTDRLAAIYGAVTSAGVFRARSIKAAEAAKVIENAQRDINIAFMNEITQIFSKLDISIWDVLAAAGTKWNFLKFQPGLVGGHCIGVDPYYLSYRAQQLGQDANVILSGRSINDGMGAWVADQLHERLGRLDRRGTEGAGAGHLSVQLGEPLQHRFILAGDHLDDAVDRMLPVAGIDALGRVAEEEVAAAHQARNLLEQRPANVLRHARIDGAFIDDHRLRGGIEQPAQHARRAQHRAEIRPVGLVDGRRHGDDVDSGAAAILRFRGETQLRTAQRLVGDFTRPIVAAAKLGDAALVDVEAGDRKMAGERDGERKPDIAQPDDDDFTDFDHPLPWL